MFAVHFNEECAAQRTNLPDHCLSSQTPIANPHKILFIGQTENMNDDSGEGVCH